MHQADVGKDTTRASPSRSRKGQVIELRILQAHLQEARACRPPKKLQGGEASKASLCVARGVGAGQEHDEGRDALLGNAEVFRQRYEIIANVDFLLISSEIALTLLSLFHPTQIESGNLPSFSAPTPPPHKLHRRKLPRRSMSRPWARPFRSRGSSSSCPSCL